MNWISEFFFCVGSMSITGSIAAGVYLLLRKKLKKTKSGVAIQILKMVTLLYLVPVAYLAVRAAKTGVSAEYLYSTGYFGISTSPVFIKVFSAIGIIWLAGLVVGVYNRWSEHKKLKGTMALNIPVHDASWEQILNTECDRYHLKGVKLCANEVIMSPMAAKILHPTIVIPMIEFNEQERHIILEHEVNHVRKHDVMWKQVAVWVSWLHWFNPLAYALLDWMSQEQEIECDLHVCSTTKYYTTKEYYLFMLSLMERTRKRIFASGLCESEDKMVRRIETVKERRNLGKAGKAMILGISLILLAVSVIPAYAMAKTVASAEEKWLAKTEVMNLADAAPADESSDLQVIRVVEDVVENDEVDVNAGVAPYSSMVIIDITGKANTRYNFKAQSMEVGDEVGITVQCSDPDVLFWIGIKNVNTNVAWYVQGTGTLAHAFTVSEAGTYRVFVENRSDTDADFLGSAVYPN